MLKFNQSKMIFNLKKKKKICLSLLWQLQFSLVNVSNFIVLPSKMRQANV